MTAWGVVLAAGRGERLGAADPKALVSLHGKPLVTWSLEMFERCEEITGIVVVLPDDRVGASLPHGGRCSIVTVAGGSTRQRSVRNALVAIHDVDAVVVHDAARPLATPDLVARALAGLEHADAAVCAVPVADTLKRVDAELVSGTVDRADLWRAQTPQAFRLDVLRSAHEMAAAHGYEATDDAELVERCGGKVVVVPGDERNVKVTTPADLELVRAMLGDVATGMRAGIGYDAHRLVDGRPLVVGGVTLPSERGLAGHSDADMLAHAICDAVLGAAALGDIGHHFPSSDERWRGASSMAFLEAAGRMLRDAGFVVVSIDATVILQRPAIGPFKDEMRARIATALGTSIDRVSIKATTTDEMGHIGAGEGAAAVAVARVEPR